MAVGTKIFFFFEGRPFTPHPLNGTAIKKRTFCNFAASLQSIFFYTITVFRVIFYHSSVEEIQIYNFWIHIRINIHTTKCLNSSDNFKIGLPANETFNYIILIHDPKYFYVGTNPKLFKRIWIRKYFFKRKNYICSKI